MFSVATMVDEFAMQVHYWARSCGRFERLSIGAARRLRGYEAVTAWAVLPHSIGDGLHARANREAYRAALDEVFPHGIGPSVPALPGVVVPYLGEVPDAVAELSLEAATDDDYVADRRCVPRVFEKMTGESWSSWCRGGREAFWEGFTTAATADAAFPHRTSDFAVDQIAAWLGVDTSGAASLAETIGPRADLTSLLAHDPRRASVEAGRRAWHRWMTEFLDPRSPVAW